MKKDLNEQMMSMSVIDREKQDRVLKSYILELQKLMGDNFKYAEAQSCVLNEKWVEDKITVIIVMRERRQDMAFLTKKVDRITTKYNKRSGVIIQPVLQWANDGACSATGSRKCMN